MLRRAGSGLSPRSHQALFRLSAGHSELKAQATAADSGNQIDFSASISIRPKTSDVAKCIRVHVHIVPSNRCRCLRALLARLSEQVEGTEGSFVKVWLRALRDFFCATSLRRSRASMKIPADDIQVSQQATVVDELACDQMHDIAFALDDAMDA